MKHMQKLLALLLCVVMMLGVLPMGAWAAEEITYSYDNDVAYINRECVDFDGRITEYVTDATEDYRTWAQTDSRWGSITMGSSSDTIARYGCTVTSITKLIIQAGLKNSSSFTVATLATWLRDNGGYNKNSALYWRKPAEMVSGFSYNGAVLSSGTYTSSSYTAQILNWIKQGYHMTIQVKNGGHWIAVDEAKSLTTGEIYIMDSMSNTQNADIILKDRYSTFNRIEAYTGGKTPTGNPPYLDKCKYYPSYMTVKMSKAEKLWSLPCSDVTDSSSKVLATLSKGDVLTVTAVYENTASPIHYWYKVKTSSGQEGYVYCPYTTVAAYTNDSDIKIANVTSPGALEQGNSFSIKGDISTTYNTMVEISAFVKDSSGTTKISSSSGAIDQKSYSLYNNPVDRNLKFGQLPTGSFTYSVEVKAKTYYSTDGLNLESKTFSKKVIDGHKFTVGVATCTVTFDACGGTVNGSGSASMKVAKGAQIGDLPSAYVATGGYDCIGWFTAKTGGSEITSSTVINNDMTVYAHYCENSSKLQFDLNGGSFTRFCPDEKASYTYYNFATNQNVTVDNYAAYLAGTATGFEWERLGEMPFPHREGYVFTGWYTNGCRCGYGDYYAGNQLKAIWEKPEDVRPIKEYTDPDSGHLYQRFDCQMSWEEAKAFCEARGGHLVTITSAAENQLVIDLITSSDNADKALESTYYIGASDAQEEGKWVWITGETFDYENWDKNLPEPNGKTTENYSLIMAVDNPVNKSVGEWLDCSNTHFGDVYATINSGFICEFDIVTPATYTITYNANGGSGAPSAQTKTAGTALTLSTTKPTRSGYTFLGWAESSTATTATYQPGGSFTKDADTTLYAVWKENPYLDVRISAPSGISTSDFNFDVYIEGKNVAFIVDSFHKSYQSGTKYEVKNINAHTEYTGCVFDHASGSLSGTIGDSSVEIILYFVKATTYTITYSANGGSGAPSAQTKTAGTALTLSTTKPTRDGYTFLGWAESSTATTATYQPGDSFTKDANTTLYAVWKQDTAPVTDDLPIKLVASYSKSSKTATVSVVTKEAVTLSNYDVTLSWPNGFTLTAIENGQPAKLTNFQKNLTTGKIAAASSGDDVTLAAGETLATVTFTTTEALKEDEDYIFRLKVQDAANAEGEPMSWKDATVTGILTVSALSEESFDQRGSDAYTLDCAAPVSGDFTVTGTQACVVLYSDGTGYKPLAATLVAGNTYAYTLPGDYSDAQKIIVAVRGDFNKDGEVSSTDALQVLRCAAGNRTFGPEDVLICDINGDGEFTSTDALQLLRVSVGLRTLAW